MSSDNGTISNVPVKTFDGTYLKFGPLWLYLTDLLTTNGLFYAVMMELKNEPPESETTESQTVKQTQYIERNSPAIGYLRITLTSS